MKIKALALASVVSLMGFSAHAVTLDVTGGTALAFGGSATYDSDCADGGDVNDKKCYNPNGAAGALTEDLLTFEEGSVYPGLTIDEGAIVTVTFLGFESGAPFNRSLSVGGAFSVDTTDALGSSYTFNLNGIDPITVDINFLSSNGGFAGSDGIGNDAALAFSGVFNGGKSVYAFFDDSGAAVNRDFDDMVVRIDVQPIPLPASALLLLGGLGMVGAMRRRKTA